MFVGYSIEVIKWQFAKGIGSNYFAKRTMGPAFDEWEDCIDSIRKHAEAYLADNPGCTATFQEGSDCIVHKGDRIVAAFIPCTLYRGRVKLDI